MDKLLGTIVPVSTDKKIASIQVNIRIKVDGIFKVSDVQLQESQSQTQFNPPAFEQITDEPEEMHFNFLARGNTTVIVPYMSETPYNTEGKVLPCETDYITTPIKTDLLIHKQFLNSSETISLGSGVSSSAKRFDLNTNVDAYTHCIYDGYTSQKYIGEVEQKGNIFIGRELRLANGDCKFTLGQNKKRKSTGILYARKTRREV